MLCFLLSLWFLVYLVSIWKSPEIGVPPNDPFIDDLSIKSHPFGVPPIFGTPHIIFHYFDSLRPIWAELRIGLLVLITCSDSMTDMWCQRQLSRLWGSLFKKTFRWNLVCFPTLCIFFVTALKHLPSDRSTVLRPMWRHAFQAGTARRDDDRKRARTSQPPIGTFYHVIPRLHWIWNHNFAAVSQCLRP